MSFPDKAMAFHATIDTAPAYWNVDILWVMLATAEQTGGGWSMMWELCPKGSGPPPHKHAQDEFFYILDGMVTFTHGDEIVRAQSGSLMSVPKNTSHNFRVDTDTATLLNMYVPGGFERVPQEAGRAASTRELPPPGLQQELSPEQLRALFAEVGMTVEFDKKDRLR
jgi:mannose-6-phosphate isomerase-like protein (cupin superfamily)